MSKTRTNVWVLIQKNNTEQIEIHGSIKSISRKELKLKRHSVDGVKIKTLTYSILNQEVKINGYYEDEDYHIYRNGIIKNK